MKNIEVKLIAELMKNSRRSDRELAKTLGISQPTVTRTRAKLEKEGYKGDWLLLDFGRVTAANANLILRDDQKCADVCIDVQVPGGNGGWQTVEVLHPRDFWAMESVNMSAYLPASGNFIVRLLWTATHRLDYVGLDTSSQTQAQMCSAVPIVAYHSTIGVVTEVAVRR